MPRTPRHRRRSSPRSVGGATDAARDELGGLQDLVRLSAGAEGVQVRRVHPAQASKVYRCPGCQQEIPVHVGHVVVVPLDDPGSRRHWHTSCWVMRDRRRPGR